VIILSFLGVILLQSCNKEKTPADLPGFKLTETLSREKQLADVTEQTVQSEIVLTGKISFNEDKVARVFPLAGGFVKELFVELGDYVHKGQTLAIIRSPEIAGFTKEGEEAKAQVQVAERQAKVAEELYKSSIISELDLMEKRKDLENARAEYARIKDVLDMYGAASGSVYPIRSPVSGIVTQKNIALNMELRTEEINPAFIVGSLEEVWVMANIYEIDIAKIKEGYDAHITVAAYPDRVYTGKIDKIFSLLDAESRVVKARITLSNTNFDLKPEMFANVKIKYAEQMKKIAIPSTALIFDKSRHFAMVYKADDNIETREVTIFKETSDIVYIETGLTSGEKVMTKHQLLVYDALND
jgi:cobalt-zinc-cadmium efflux system membrane fusion protein